LGGWVAGGYLLKIILLSTLKVRATHYENMTTSVELRRCAPDRFGTFWLEAPARTRGVLSR
jgi:hypothetical protein